VNKLLEELKARSPLQIFSVIADLMTVLGISVATIVAGPFLSGIRGIRFDPLDFILLVLFYFIFICLYAYSLYRFTKTLITNIADKMYIDCLLNIIAILIFAAVAFYFTPIAYSSFGSASNNSYIIPKSASDAVQHITHIVPYNSYKNGDVSLKCRLVFSEDCKKSDYVAVVYTRMDGIREYSIHTPVVDYEFDIDADGFFTIPAVSSKNLDDQNELFVAIFRKVDWRLRRTFLFQKGYPDHLLTFPTEDVKELRPYVFKITKQFDSQMYRGDPA